MMQQQPALPGSKRTPFLTYGRKLSNGMVWSGSNEYYSIVIVLFGDEVVGWSDSKSLCGVVERVFQKPIAEKISFLFENTAGLLDNCADSRDFYQQSA